MASSDFDHMLSVDAIRFELGFAHPEVPCTWQLPWLAREEPWSAVAGPFLALLAQTGSGTTPLAL